MTFGAKSDALAKDISAVVVHLYTQDAKLDLSMGKTPALAAVTEVRTLHHVHACMHQSIMHTCAHSMKCMCTLLRSHTGMLCLAWYDIFTQI